VARTSDRGGSGQLQILAALALMTLAARRSLSIAIAALLAAAAQAAPRDLDAAALDEATAGAQSPSDSHRAGDGVSIIVADQASIDADVRSEIVLGDSAQTRTTALNVVNASSADVANALNVSMGAAVIARQLNDVFQVQHSYGRVERLSLSGPNLSRSWQDDRSRSLSSAARSTQIALLQSRSHTTVSDTWSAGVPAYFPLQNLTLTLGTPDMPAVTVPAFGFDLTTTDDVGGTYGIRGDLGPFTFDPPQIVLGTVSFQGDDLLIEGGYVDLPSLDLGAASITACFIDCGTVSVDLPTIDGPRIDLPGEWRFAGANPFKDVRINAGHGVAAAGRGRIELEAAHVTLGAELSLDLPDLTTSFSFDVLGQTVSTGEFGVEIPAISASITLVDADIGPGYSAEFDGALCLAVQTNECGTLSHSESSQSIAVDIRQASASAAAAIYEERSSSGEEHITPGATLTGAEAELIAMSAGEASIEQASVVGLGSEAQRGLSALNAVNAAGAIVGNAVNVNTQRAGAVGLAQSNVFTQHKTRPRGP
jgi:hypothetical protein